MEKLFVDLHVHSYFSDGSMSPVEIAASANEKGVGLLALADHDTIEGNELLRTECLKYGIQCIPAVEIDSIDGNTNFHILAYGYNSGDCEFINFLKHTRFLLDESGIKLVELMKKDYQGFSLSDYMDFTYDKRLGGWKALHYLMAKGLTASLKDGVKFYFQYDMSYDKAGYSTIAAIAYRIKKAGGYSVLAHPGELINVDNIDFSRRNFAGRFRTV